MSIATSIHPISSSIPLPEVAMSQNPSNGHRRSLASKFRGATVADLDLAPALSITPSTPISTALLMSYDRDYSQLTVISSQTRSLLGYLDIPKIKSLLADKQLSETDTVSKAMNRFRKKGKVYRIITPDTTLEELEEFLSEPGREFAIVTDDKRRFVLGVATREDLEKFVARRPD